MSRLNIEDGETVLVAWAQSHAGPGWANYLVHFIVRGNDGKLREDALQPDEQTPEMATLFSVSKAAANSMTGVVEARLRARKHLERGVRP